MTYYDDHFHDECGVIGIIGAPPETLSSMLYYGLVSLQHRGQESAGMALYQNGQMKHFKEMGLVQEMFSKEILQRLQGDVGIGHVRYSTTGDSLLSNAQPLVVRHKGGHLALAHNGNLVNAERIRSTLENAGALFSTTIDTEVIATLIAQAYAQGKDLQTAVEQTLCEVRGAFSLTMIIEGKLVVARDPLGLRPLVIGKKGDIYIVASETCALDVLGATFLRDVEAGEMIVIDEQGLHPHFYLTSRRRAMCSFEYVYFAMPDSTLDGRNVYLSRKKAGKILYREHPVEADMVVAVPDSGIAASIGFAEASGIPFDLGMIKNKYVGRTFIQPSQEMRELAVRLKLNVLAENVNGKRIVLIDDSIVRGTTIKKLADMLRRAGAKEVHIRVCSPPVKYPCFFGIDTPNRQHLIAANHSVEDICKKIGADSLGYISEEGLVEAIEIPSCKLCTACFNGDYPMETGTEDLCVQITKR